MTPEQIRSLAIERIARHLYDEWRSRCAGIYPPWDYNPETDTYVEGGITFVPTPGPWRQKGRHRTQAARILDALGDLLPDGESWGVAQPGEAEPMSWWDTEDAEETVRKQLRVSAGRPLRRWLHRSWREVSEQSPEQKEGQR